MADVRLPVQALNRVAGLKATYNAALSTSDTYLVANNNRVTVHVKNGGESNITITVATPGTVDGLAIADRTYTVEDGDEAFLGPWPTDTYNDAVGDARITFSAITSVSAAAIGMPIG